MNETDDTNDELDLSTVDMSVITAVYDSLPGRPLSTVDMYRFTAAESDRPAAFHNWAEDWGPLEPERRRLEAQFRAIVWRIWELANQRKGGAQAQPQPKVECGKSCRDLARKERLRNLGPIEIEETKES